MTADPRTPATEPNSAQPDFSTVEGDWISVTELPFGISRVLARRTDDGLDVHAYGAGGPGTDDWGAVGASGIFVMRSGAGVVFTAEFENATMWRQLQSYRSMGVLAVTGFHRFLDGSGRRDFFTREHYVRAGLLRSVPGPGAADGLPDALRTGDHDPSGLLGTWHPVDPPARTVAVLECERSGGGVALRVQGVGTDGPVDWGTTAARLYSDLANPEGNPAMLATFDRGDRLVHLEFRMHMGVLVVGEYVQFTDGSRRPDSYLRECYFAR